MTLFLSLQTMVLAVEKTNSASTQKVKVIELEKFDPEKQVTSLVGYNLRARKIIVPAGVSIGEHAHDTRPGIVYVESGEIIEYRGDSSRLLKAGDSLVEDATTVHGYKNISNKNCVLIAFDLPKTGKK